MRIHSDSFANGAPIPAEFAGGDAQGFAPDRNPHLAAGAGAGRHAQFRAARGRSGRADGAGDHQPR